MAKHFLLHTFGSLGDLHPLIALGLGLQARGHRVTIGTSEPYRHRVEKAGLGFIAIRPNFDASDPALLAKVMDSKTGTQYVFKDLTLPYLKETYADLSQALKGADVLVSSSLTFAAPLVAEKSGKPWISCVYAPVSFFSAYDPSVINTPMSHWISRRGPGLNRWFFDMGKIFTNPWAKPLYEFRKELGLPRGQSPFFEAQHSPRLALALFSKYYAAPQKDWPPNSQATGFLFYDGSQDIEKDLESFLHSGDAPIVFTLGSSAVHAAGDFYQNSLDAVRKLGCRAVLLVGREGLKTMPERLPENVFATAYAPYSRLFPRAAAVVHQGGIGTTAQTLRAGKPALIMPFAHDQFDNGLRIQRLGAGLTVRKQDYKSKAAGLLSQLLESAQMKLRAQDLGHKIQAELGLEQACEALENAFS